VTQRLPPAETSMDNAVASDKSKS